MRLSRRHVTAALVFLVLAAVYLLPLAPESKSLDAEAAHFGAWHLAVEESRWVEDAEFAADHPLRHVWVAQNGVHEVISRAPGVVALGWPAYKVLGGDEFAQRPALIAAALFTAVAMMLFFLGISTRLTTKASAVTTIALGLGTPVWSVAADAIWPHTVTLLAVSGMVWGAATGRWWVVGLFAGMGMWGRSHFAVVAAVVGLGVALHRRSPSIAVKVGLPSALLLGGSVLWSRWMFGVWRATGANAVGSASDLSDRYDSLWLNELGLLVSPGRGLFLWTPVLLVLLPALVRSWRQIPDWTRWMCVAGLTYTGLQGYAQIFHGGDSYWGYRLTLELLACAAPAFAFSLHAVGRAARQCAVVLLGCQVLLTALGTWAGLGGVAAEDVWSHHALVDIWLRSPLMTSVLIVLAALLSLLAARIVRPVDFVPSDENVSAPRRQDVPA